MLISGCAGWREIKQGWSAGHTPCLASEVSVDEAQPETSPGVFAWRAVCRGQTYVCSRLCTAYSGAGLCVDSQTQCAKQP